MSGALSEGKVSYSILKQKKLVHNTWWDGDITCGQQWAHLFIHTTNRVADEAAAYCVKPGR